LQIPKKAIHIAKDIGGYKNGKRTDESQQNIDEPATALSMKL
jgi:hypothetical protein